MKNVRYKAMKNVRYEKAQRERAKAEKKWLATISVDGRHLKDQFLLVQVNTDLHTARQLAELAFKLMSERHL